MQNHIQGICKGCNANIEAVFEAHFQNCHHGLVFGFSSAGPVNIGTLAANYRLRPRMAPDMRPTPRRWSLRHPRRSWAVIDAKRKGKCAAIGIDLPHLHVGLYSNSCLRVSCLI